MPKVIDPWRLWSVESALIGELAVSVGYSRAGKPLFAGLRKAQETIFLEILEGPGKDDLMSEVTPLEDLGPIPKGIPKWTHATLCNGCGKKATHLEMSQKWICQGPCREAVPITLESSQMREFLEEAHELMNLPLKDENRGEV